MIDANSFKNSAQVNQYFGVVNLVLLIGRCLDETRELKYEKYE